MKLPYLIIISVGVMTFLGCERGTGNLEPPDEDLPDQVIQDFVLIETDGEDVVWKLYADKAEIFESRNEAVIYEVRIDFYEEGEYASTLTSDTGVVDTLRNDMTARGHVVLNSKKENAVLRTEELSWNAETQLITSDYEATLEKGDSVIIGQGFEASPGLSRFKTEEMVAEIDRDELGREEGETGGGETE
jgi:LPS export ABC transporter protein LptC